MAIPISSNYSASNATSSAGATAKTASEQVGSADMKPAEKAKLQLNASILQASLNVSIGSENQPLSLLYKTAITNINESLKAELGDNAIQNAASQDNSAEATANRIVSLSTGFFEAFKTQNPGADDDATLQKFMDTVKGGFEKGFKEAQNILKGLNVLQGDIASGIDKTYELVQKGFADFQAAHVKGATDGAAKAA